MFSLLIYGALLMLLYSNSAIASRKRYRSVHYHTLWFSFFVISILLGGRYNVGTDWVNYKEYYDDIAANGINWLSGLEPLYLLLNKLVAGTGLSSSFFFTCISLIQLSIIYAVFKDDKKHFALGMSLYFLCCLSISLNIIRQSLAICIFLYAVRFIGVSFPKFLCAIIIAGLFHYSSFVLLLVYLLNKNVFFYLDKRACSIALYIISIFGGAFMLIHLQNLIPLDLLGYKYSNNLNNADIEMSVSSGMGILINHMLNGLLLWYLPSLKKHFSDKEHYITIVSRAFVIGLILANVFGLSVFLSRLALPLVMLKIILIPYIFHYLVHSRSSFKVLVSYGLLAAYILLFFVGILNGAGGIYPY